eukprot:647566-Ditylum_brightwellii.AAC.1
MKKRDGDSNFVLVPDDDNDAGRNGVKRLQNVEKAIASSGDDMKNDMILDGKMKKGGHNYHSRDCDNDGPP